MLHIDQLHAQLPLADHLAAAKKLDPLLLVDFVSLASVVVIGLPEDLANALLALEVLGRPIGGLAEYLSPLEASAAAHDHGRRAAELLRTTDCELGNKTHQAITNDVALGRSFRRKPAAIFAFEFRL
jgi:hypothetical protein